MSHKRQLHIFVLIDALGWRLLEHHEFLTDVFAYRRPLRTVLGFSSGAIPAILTGLPPTENGHWNLFYYDPERSPFRWLRFFRFLPDRLLNHRVARKLMKELGRRVLGLGPSFECCVSPRVLPFFNWAEKRNIYGRDGITGAPSIFDQLALNGVPYHVYSYHQWSDREILRQAQRDLKAGGATFFFLYLSEMDSFLHHHREHAAQLEQRLGWYASGLRELFERAREIDPEVSFTVFSDHGMTPVRHHYDLVKDVDSLGFSMPHDYLAVYDSTMARFWFFSEKARLAITHRLKDLSCGRIVPDAELKELGVFFPDRRYGEVILLMRPGWMISRSDFNGPGWMPAGMHGYHPEDPDSDAVFLSNRPPPIDVHTISDVYVCMSEAAGLPVGTPVSGSRVRT